MAENLEKFKLMERIKISSLINRGDPVAVSEELKLPLDYVKKILIKIRKQELKNINLLVANNVMEYIIMGYKARTHNLTEMWKALLGRDKSLISTCCEKPVKKCENKDKNGKEYECLACGLRCHTELVDEEGIIDLKMGILEQLREEDRALIEFADKMGYTNKEPSEPPFQIKQNILVMGSEKDKQIIEDYNKLSPMARQQLIDKLDKQILEITKTEEKTDENKNEPNQ